MERMLKRFNISKIISRIFVHCYTKKSIDFAQKIAKQG